MSKLWRPLLSFTVWSAAACVCLQGQELLRLAPDGDGYLRSSDLAVLSSDEKRDDLACEVEELDPQLEYDLNFRAGYNAKIPLNALSGPGNRLRVVVKITALDSDQDPVFLHKVYTVPPISEGAEGEANLPGKYRVGPGNYRVNWLMRDRAERVCASSWEIEAKTLEEFERLAAAPDENLIEPVSDNAFYEEPPVMRPREDLRSVKLMINFTPSNPSMAGLSEYDLSSVVSMARAITREPRFGSFSVVAYQSQRERVFFEQHDASQVDFVGLGDALENVQGGTVDISSLQDKESSRRFIRELFEEHLAKSEDEPDAVIFLGPKLVFDRSPESNVLAASDVTPAPIYYFIYNRNPRAYPWRDAVSAGLGNAGLREFNISRAKEFGQALKDTLASLDEAESLMAGEPSHSSER